ncbi:MAG: site-2 protease family protein [Pseudomonadota bacterium]
MQSRVIDLVLFYPLFLFSLSFHEAAHGLIADKFGDSTARLMGRVSLSPFPHIDIVGTVILPILGILTGAPVIGWGKPVPVNPYNLKGDMRRSNMWVAVAGPASNVLLALAFAGMTHMMVFALPRVPGGLLVHGSMSATVVGAAFAICEMGVVLNLVLAAFNLLPMPPLDGGSVLRGLLPESGLAAFDQFSRYSFMILLMLFFTGMLRYLLVPVMMLANYLLPG